MALEGLQRLSRAAYATPFTTSDTIIIITIVECFPLPKRTVARAAVSQPARSGINGTDDLLRMPAEGEPIPERVRRGDLLNFNDAMQP